MNFTPNGAWVVLPSPAKTQTDSGIILDEKTAKSISTNILEVLAVGPNCTFLKKGDTAMVDPRGEAIVIEVDNKPYIMVMEHQVLGKM